MTRSLPLFVMSSLALCVAQAVQAADVDVYGIADVGMHYTDSKYGDSFTTMDSGISKGSRIGLRGSEISATVMPSSSISKRVLRLMTAPSTIRKTDSLTETPTWAWNHPTAKCALVDRAPWAPA